MTDGVYAALLAAFLAHDLHAARRREWRILPVLRALPDRVGAEVFVWGHVPLVIAVLLASMNGGFRLGLAGFAVVHAGLHWRLRRHPENAFGNASSWALILPVAALGAAYPSLS